MASDPKPRVKAPKSVKAGEVFEIKTLISHNMESGQRKDKDGKPIPRQIINRFVCSFEGAEIFAMDLHPSISANPYISFHVKLDKSGELKLAWHDDNGSVYEDVKAVTVEG